MAESTLNLVTCPRCGYDLRGAIAAWTESCPLRGKCTECGLALDWAEVMSGSAYEPLWCVEFAARRRVIAAAFATMVMVFVPWKLWSSVRMDFPVRGGRLATYVAVLMATCYLSFCVAHGQYVRFFWRASFGPPTPMTNPMSASEAAARAALSPFSDAPLGQVVLRSGAIRRNNSSWEMVGVWRDASCVLLFGLLVVVAAPCVPAALLASRHRAAVRLRHLVRLVVYSLGWLPGLWGLVLATALLHTLERMLGRSLAGLWAVRGEYAMLIGVPLLVFLWWEAAVRQYLHMQLSWAIAVAVTLLAVGGGLALMGVLAPGFVGYVFYLLGLSP